MGEFRAEEGRRRGLGGRRGPAAPTVRIDEEEAGGVTSVFTPHLDATGA
jgi:hypothetical protein